VEKSSQKFGLFTYVIFKKLPKETNSPIGEKPPNLVTLLHSCRKPVLQLNTSGLTSKVSTSSGQLLVPAQTRDFIGKQLAAKLAAFALQTFRVLGSML
jgi:hypothetical protein